MWWWCGSVRGWWPGKGVDIGVSGVVIVLAVCLGVYVVLGAAVSFKTNPFKVATTSLKSC